MWCMNDNIKDEVETFRRNSMARHPSIEESPEQEQVFQSRNKINKYSALEYNPET